MRIEGGSVVVAKGRKWSIDEDLILIEVIEEAKITGKEVKEAYMKAMPRFNNRTEDAVRSRASRLYKNGVYGNPTYHKKEAEEIKQTLIDMYNEDRKKPFRPTINVEGTMTGRIKCSQKPSKREEFIRECVYTYLKKNNDYGDSFVKSLEKHGSIAYIVRAEDKLNRIESILKKSEGHIRVEDESINDTVLDLFNYTAMYLHWKYGHTTLLNLVGIVEDCLNNDFINILEAVLGEIPDNVCACIIKVIQEKTIG